ncbi:RdgB/HAM1 family non-canonical purine NTP pyrophosphatase [Arthrobacter sp. 92]|uniref:RdgB/HAM1 family non-canonical purine NTP pyrophosphatase n=1 Tax=Arthrobacter sp. 92 TaxID=3418175 RepID=UPI003CFC2285
MPNLEEYMNGPLVLITGNAGKAAEFSRLLGVQVLAKKINLPEVQGIDVREVAHVKAQAAFNQIGGPVFVDDSGIEFSAWGGLPGALTSWFMDSVGNEGLLRMLQGFDDRTAKVVTALGYCDEQGVRVVSGEVVGLVSESARGDSGFGYDPIFMPHGSHKTFAEMTLPEKDAVSMRAIAASKLSEILNIV